jgi:hypothetical protein
MTLIDWRQVPAVLGWGGVAAVMIAPVVIAAFSPFSFSRSCPRATSPDRRGRPGGAGTDGSAL